MAHRAISLLRSNRIALGAKRTSILVRQATVVYEYTAWREDARSLSSARALRGPVGACARV